MTTIGDQIWIDAPPERVWRRVADLGGVVAFHPGLSGSHLVGRQAEGVGARRRCELKDGRGHIDEEVVEWTDRESLALTITGGKGLPPFSRAVGRFALRGTNGGTVVDFALEYELRYGLLGRLMDAALVRREFGKTVRGVLHGLKGRVEADETKPAA